MKNFLGIINKIRPLRFAGSEKGVNGNTKKIVLKISGMHCTACSLNIDLDLEETKGIISSKTNYAKSLSEITYDPKLISLAKILQIIQKTGYQAYAD